MRGRGPITKFIFLAALVYLSFVAVMFMQQRKLVFQAVRLKAAPPDIAEIARVRTSDGLALEGWYFKPKEGYPVLVYFHGNGGVMAGRAMKIPDYLNAGYGVLLTEYRGYGGNPGSPTEAGVYADGWAYLDWLAREKGIGPERIVFYGESLGTGVSVELASKMSADGAPPLAVVLEAPFTSLVDAARATYFFLPVDLLLLDRFMSIDKIAGVRAPVFIINGEHDEVIPATQGQVLYKAAGEPKRYVQILGGRHSDLHLLGLSGYVLDFLAGFAPPNEDNEGTESLGE